MISFVRNFRDAGATRRWRRGVLRVIFCVAVVPVAGLVAVSAAWGTAPTNRGGVLLLHAEGDRPYDYGTLDHCGDLSLLDPARAVTRLPGDGVPRVVGVYAVFPPDSVGSVKAFSFGIRYSENVRIVGQAPCNAAGMSIAMNGWPASNGGMSVHIADEGVKKSRIIPLYWFAIMSKGKGSVELIPHPVPKLAGRFVTAEVPYQQEPIAAYGRLGFESDGFVPTAGARPVMGSCCVDQCWLLTRQECEQYRGIYLGDGMTCDHDPCRDDAYLGGCCLPSGCEMLSLVACSREGGTPLGEGVRCDSLPCPQPKTTGAPSK
jgi:hypothetical protein